MAVIGPDAIYCCSFDATGITLTPFPTTVSVSAVPELGTFLCLGSGMVGLMGFRWRRRRVG